MGGGTDNLDAGKLLSSASILLAFEETGDTAKTLSKVIGTGSTLLGVTGAPKTDKEGDFSVSRLTVGGMSITTASSDDVAAIQLGKDVFGTWGKDRLADSDAYKDAWDAADAPDKTAALVWLDAGRIAKLVGVKSGDKRELGGLVAWGEADGSNAKFGAFLHVPKA
jgi:hypothetical protein